MDATARPGPSCHHALWREFYFVDRSDEHTELVERRERLLSPVEREFASNASVVALEDPATGRGTVWVRAAPTAAVRGWDREPAFRGVRGEAGWMVTPGVLAGDPRCIRLFYTGGAVGLTRALQGWQLEERGLGGPGRGEWASNTWGDRSRADKLSEAFVLAEIDAAAALGVEVVQVDDGWQRGRTANTVEAGGVWDGFWAAQPDYWTPDPVRFPRGLAPLVARARERGLRLGLWYAPDSTDEAAHWERDAEQLLALWREHGIARFKLDAVKLRTPRTVERFTALLDRLRTESDGHIGIDLDTTAEARLGFWGRLDATIFVQNRYTDWGNYFPHATLRALWMLAHTVHPSRLRFELLNPARNEERYRDDPRRPAAYAPDYLFAVAMLSSPLAWCENTGLPPAVAAAWSALAAEWRRWRAELHGSVVRPVGAAPDGHAVTGFVVESTAGGVRHLLAFRETTAEPALRVRATAADGIWRRLGGEGEISVAGEELVVRLPEPRSFGWFRVG